jgi:hypothetical protein
LDSLEDRAVPAAPIITPIVDQTLSSNQSMIQVPVVAEDADGDSLSYSARAAGNDAYFLATELNLVDGDRPANWGGQGEKWLRGGDNWYFIKSNGDLHRWDGTNRDARGEKIAALQPIYFHYTTLLTAPRHQDLAYLIDQTLRLSPTARPAANTLGLNEKWMIGRGGARFFITSQGDLYRVALPIQTGARTLLAHLDPTYHANIALLTSDQARPLEVTMRGNVLQINDLSGAAGTYDVEVMVGDGHTAERATFQVRVVNASPPVIPEPAPVVLGVGENSLSVDLNISDADGDALTNTVTAAGTEAYFLDRTLNFKTYNRSINWGGEGERWFTGRDGHYFLKPSGDLHLFDNNTDQIASGELIATLPPVLFYFPDMLTTPRNEDLAWVLDQRLGLSPTASPAPDTLNLDEKWFKGKGGREYFLTPDGSFYRRTGSTVDWFADLSAEYYKQPARLYAAARDRFSASMAGDVLTVGTKPGFSGKFFVEVSASDGVHATTRLITVTQSDYVSPAAPRVVGAISASNSKLIVTFSQPMNNSATNPGNCQITQQGGTSGVASLKVLSAKFLGDDRSTVELTTLSQSEVTYTLSVVNVKDLGGTSLAGKSVSPGGVVLDPSRADFVGTPPSAADLQDTDDDGLLDHEEQRGWEVQVKLLNGSTLSRWVTSDPYVADSDGDGLADAQESNLRLDPRDRDTDDDQLNDFQEFNEIFSDSANQDTDGDTLDDSLEFNFFHSSPVERDTDGDQILDNVEIVLGNRNPRIADVPKPGIEIGAVDLRLDVRFTATNTLGSRELETRAITSTLTQTENTSYSSTDANSNEFTTSAGYAQEWSTKAGVDGIGYKGTFNVEAGYTGQWTSSFTEESSQETQEAISESFETQQETTVEESVTREVLGASMKVGVSITSLSNITFAIRNLQVVAFMQDPQRKGRLLPIATLLPDEGVPNEFTLGPLVPERGPFVFTSDQIFPSLVEQLMLDPRGLIFKIANYDMVDERGRNFAFSSQDINDRTAPLVIDFGFGDNSGAGAGGTTERYRVATSSGRVAVDTDGDGDIDGDDRPVVFNPNTGKAVGITISDAMQSIVGLTHYNETTTPSSTLTQTELMKSYSTKVVALDLDQNPATPAVNVERLWRIRDVSRDLTNPLKNWTIFTANGIENATNFSDLILKTEEGLTFKFLQDLDDDGIDAGQEYVLGSSDSAVLIPKPGTTTGEMQKTGYDTDLDGLSDAFEFFGRMPNPSNPNVDLVWNVDVVGQETIRGQSSPARSDSDLDGLTDAAEFNRFVDVDHDGNPATPAISVRMSLNPLKADTDGDGMSDYAEINGYTINLAFPPAGGPSTVTRTSDPLNPDTDGDTLPDGDGQTFGTDPKVNDAANVRDDDGDGLVNFLESLGWNVTTYAVSTTVNTQGSSTTTSSPVASLINDPDSDDDGLTDKRQCRAFLRGRLVLRHEGPLGRL